MTTAAFRPCPGYVANDQPQLSGWHGERVVPVAADQTALGRDELSAQLYTGQAR
jgi:hypothetical protein